MNGNKNLWQKIEFKDSLFEFFLEDDLSVRIEKIQNEIVVYTNEHKKETVNRFITGEEKQFFIEPGLPDLPIIVKPVQNISIIPLQKLKVFVEVPFSVRLLFGSEKRQKLLKEFVTHNLSKSFFGDSETGEFAYFLKSQLMRNIDDYTNTGKSIYCPLTIENYSSQNLEFEKMILRVPYLSIFKSQDHLISNPVVITFKGEDQISQISYKRIPSKNNENLRLITKPRMAEDKNILKKSFYLIKHLYAE